MTGAQLETFIRNQTGVGLANLSQADLFQYVNIVREDIRGMIEKKVNEDFWVSDYTGNLVSGTNSYDLASLTGTGNLFKIKLVEIKREETDEYFSRLESGLVDDSGVSRDYLSSLINKNDGFWVYEGNSVVLYPTPTSNVTGGIKVQGTYTFSDVDETSVEGTIFPEHPELKQYEYIVGMGVVPFIERHRNIKDKNDIQKSAEAYKERLSRMIDAVNTKYNSVVYGSLPNYNNYKA